ncbi:MAG TPA: hypothetical protein VGX25_19215 [Actinophytocola sp.]|nr:hypothetical protein [Actinophytocola sp.]HEV2781518.1 hypothetical protein [Actinophytocola sp.]
MVTTTTNKNLRGCRGGLILSDDPELGERLDAAVFPGIQGGPLPELICAKAVTFGEALRPEFADYAAAVLENARTLSRVLRNRGYDIVTGGTDTPLVLVDLRGRGTPGHIAERSLEAVGITCNRNLVPGDTRGPATTSGLRFGTSAVTTRGMSTRELETVADAIADVLDGLERNSDSAVNGRAVRRVVSDLAAAFPIYSPHPASRS